MRINFNRGLALGILASALLGINSTFAKVAYAAGLDPNTFTMLRLVVATAGLWLLFFTRWRQPITVTRRILVGCFLLAVANVVAQLGYYWSLTRLSGSVATLMLYVYPAIVILLLRLRGEPFTKRRFIRLSIAFLGVALLLNVFGQPVDGIGAALIGLTAVSYAIFLVLGQVVVDDLPPRLVTLYVISIMAVMTIGIRLVAGGSNLPTTWDGWWPVFGIAFVGTILARLAMFSAIKHAGSAQLSLVGVVEPLTTVVVTGVFLGEMLTPVQWLGGALIVASLLLVESKVAPANNA